MVKCTICGRNDDMMLFDEYYIDSDNNNNNDDDVTKFALINVNLSLQIVKNLNLYSFVIQIVLYH